MFYLFLKTVRVFEFRQISETSDVTATDAYPVEDVHHLLDWLLLKNVYSTYNLKDGFYQITLEQELRLLTVMWLLQYTTLS